MIFVRYRWGFWSSGKELPPISSGSHTIGNHFVNGWYISISIQSGFVWKWGTARFWGFHTSSSIFLEERTRSWSLFPCKVGRSIPFFVLQRRRVALASTKFGALGGRKQPWDGWLVMSKNGWYMVGKWLVDGWTYTPNPMDSWQNSGDKTNPTC